MVLFGMAASHGIRLLRRVCPCTRLGHQDVYKTREHCVRDHSPGCSRFQEARIDEIRWPAPCSALLVWPEIGDGNDGRPAVWADASAAHSFGSAFRRIP